VGWTRPSHSPAFAASKRHSPRACGARVSSQTIASAVAQALRISSSVAPRSAAARRKVSDACLKDVRPFLVEQERAVATLNRVVVQPERLVSLLHLPDDERAVDDRLEAANSGAFVERKDVSRLDGLGFAIHITLRHGDAGAERRDLRLDRNPRERDRNGLSGEQSGVGCSG
jgi:hypothetical protein